MLKYFSLLFFFIGCGTSDSEKKMIKYGKTVTKVIDSEEGVLIAPKDSFDFPESLEFPLSMTSLGDNLLFVDGRTDSLVHVYDPEYSEIVGQCLIRGDGPNEARGLWAVKPINKSTFSSIETRTRDIISYSISAKQSDFCHFVERIENPFQGKPSQVILNNQEIIASQTGYSSVISYDKRLRQFNEVCSALIIDGFKGVDTSIIYNSFVQGGVLAQASENKILFFRKYAPIIEVISLEKKSTENVILVDKPWEVKYSKSKNKIGLKARETKSAFLDISFNDNHIFALYSGEIIIPRPGFSASGTYIYKINRLTHDVEEIYRYDKGMTRIAVVDNLLYGYNTNVSESIYMFDLPI